MFSALQTIITTAVLICELDLARSRGAETSQVWGTVCVKGCRREAVGTVGNLVCVRGILNDRKTVGNGLLEDLGLGSLMLPFVPPGPPPPPDFLHPAVCPGRRPSTGRANGLPCCLVSGWVWPVWVGKRWEGGRRVRLGRFFFWLPPGGAILAL